MFVVQPVTVPLTRVAAGIVAWKDANPLRAFFGTDEQGAYFRAYNPDDLIKRRNLLLWSEAFANSAGWGVSRLLPITENADGVGDLIVPDTTNASHLLQQNVAVPGKANAVTVRAKAGGYDWIAVQVGGIAAYFNVNAGAVGYVSAGMTASISAAEDEPGYFDCVALNPVSATSQLQIYFATGNQSPNYTGDGAKGVYLARAQVELGTAPSPYQLVTDWNTEYIAAGGNRIGMWQDPAGTTPVTGVEQPVGLLLDMKRGGVRGPELVTNGACTGTAGWTGNVILTSPNNATIRAETGAGGISATASSAFPVVAGKSYEITFDLIAASNFGRVGLAGTGDVTISSGAGPKRYVLNATANHAGGVVFNTNTPTTGHYIEVDNVSVRELPGNHATEATAPNRPVLSALVNKVTGNNFSPTTFGAAFNSTSAPNGLTVFSVVDDTVALAAAGLSRQCPAGKVYRIDNTLGDGTAYAFPLGTTGDTTSHAVSSYMRVGGSGAAVGLCLSVTGNGLSTTTSGAYVWLSASGTGGATSKVQVNVPAGRVAYLILFDLRSIEDVSPLIPAYQRVNTPTDYDTVGFPHYLKANGVNTRLATGNVDFSGTDKITVVTAVTKMSDAARGMVVELGAGGTNSFAINGPNTPGNTNYVFASGGSIGAAAQPVATNAVAPTTDVISATADIGADSATISRNGVQAAMSNADQGAGNYSNAALYLLARAGSSLFFNGRLYSLAIVGAAKDAATIARAERFMAREARKVLA